MQIRVKRKPINKKKLLRGLYVAAAMGLVFGTMAALSFAFLYAGLNKNNETKPTEVIVQVENETNRTTEGDDRQNVDPVKEDTTPAIERSEIYKTAEKIEKAIVRLNMRYTESYSVAKGDSKVKTGIIYTINNDYIMILASPNSVRGMSTVDVTFYDGKTVEGEVIETDYISGLSAIRVQTDKISYDKLSVIPQIEFANSNKTEVGDVVIAIGNLDGNGISIAAGNVTNTSQTFSCLDGELAMLETDILSKNFSNGFLINQSGLVCGVISHENDTGATMINYTNAIGCSDLTATIYKMSRGIHFPYMGIKTQTITSEIARIYGVPLGIFVTAVESNSPALEAGFMPGDIIVDINSKGIMTGRGLHSFMMSFDMEKDISKSITVRVLRTVEDSYRSIELSVRFQDRYN